MLCACLDVRVSWPTGTFQVETNGPQTGHWKCRLR